MAGDVGGLQIKLELADTAEIEAALDRVTEKLQAMSLAAREAKDALESLSVPGRLFSITCGSGASGPAGGGGAGGVGG